MTEVRGEFIILPFKRGVKLIKPKQEKSRLYTTVLDLLNLPCSTYFETGEGIIKATNERNAAFCGYDSPMHAIGKNYFDALPSTAQAILRANDQQVMRNGVAVLDEYIPAHETSIAHHLSIKSPWYSADGVLVGLFGISIISGQDHFSKPLTALSALGLLNGLDASIEFKLTPRQRDCAQLLLRGFNTSEMAQSLHLSERTIESYLDNLKAKLKCRNRIELAAKMSKLLN